jgi:cephalosporin-C deacetylase-like acetyl esterase
MFVFLNVFIAALAVSAADGVCGIRADTTIDILTSLKIPVVTGSLVIDGKVTDPSWQGAATLMMKNAALSSYGDGGDARIAVRGKYLCLAAVIPEDRRLVVRSTGINPVWEREDLIAWRLKYQSPADGRTYFTTVAVNAFGALSLFAGDTHYFGNIGDDVINSRRRLIGIHGAVSVPRNEFVRATGSELEWVKDILCAAAIGDDGWSVEVALPLKEFGPGGFISIERVRAPRPTAPQLSWFWPAANVRQYFQLPPAGDEPAPAWQPPTLPKNDAGERDNPTPDALSRDVATLPAVAWTKEERASLDAASMLERSLRSRMAAFAEEEKRAWKKVNTREDWEKFRDRRLAALRDWIGPMPERTPLRTTVTKRLSTGDGFVIENLVFESRPHLLVSANLYLPEKISAKMPALIVIHSHHAPKTQVELQDLGMTSARAGTAVLIMDQINAGERSQSQPWARESYYGRYATGNQLYLAGESLIKWMAWDIIRGVDVLLERPYIDPDRIVLLGAVAGGGDPAALTATLDPRIDAVIPFCFGEAGPEEHYTEGPRPYDAETADPGWAFWETTRNLPHSAREQYFPWFLCAAGAPRPFIFAFELGWPQTVEEEPIWSRYKKVYQFYDAADRLADVDGFGPFPGPGETNQVATHHRQQIDKILHRWFDFPIPAGEVHDMRSESELACITAAAARAAEAEPVAEIARQLAEERLSAARAARARLTPAEAKAALRLALEKKLGDIEPIGKPLVTSLWSRRQENFRVEASSVQTEKGIVLPVFLLIPDKGPARHPVVMALAQAGKAAWLTERPTEIAALLAKGISVCLPDLRGMGELNASTSRGPGAMNLAANELMLGGTMTGARLKDARTIFHWLSRRRDVDPKAIAVWGDSFSEANAPGFNFDQSPGQVSGPISQRQAEPLGPFLAQLTALYEDDVSAVACRGGLVSFLSVLDDRFSQIPQDVIVPGLLQVADLADIVSAIGPRTVLLQDLVDGRNKRVLQETIKNEYRVSSPNVTLGENTGALSPAAWLTEKIGR